MTGESPQNADAERQVLGALLVHEPALRAVFDDVKLRTSDFAFEGHRAVFSVVQWLYGEGDPVDAVTVVEGLRGRGMLDLAGGEEKVWGFADQVSAPGNVRAHALIVAENARWRGKQKAQFLIGEAVRDRDESKIGEARALLDQHEAHSGTSYSEQALAVVARGLLEQGGGETFRYPFERLNRFTAGGMRRGEFVLLAGHESHGKTVFLDQTMEHLHRQGTSQQLYLTEMTVPERVARTMSRRTGIPYDRIMEGRMTESQAGVYEEKVDRAFKFGMTDATGWSIDEIAGDIRARRLAVAAVDTVHDIPHEETKDLERIARVLAATSRQADCAVIGVAHVNRARVKQAQAPRPTRGDILGSGQFAKSANTVCFVHRQETKNGFPTLDGWVFFAKVRNGRLGEVEVRLDPGRYRFEERLPDGDPGPVPPNERAEKEEPSQSEIPF